MKEQDEGAKRFKAENYSVLSSYRGRRCRDSEMGRRRGRLKTGVGKESKKGMCNEDLG